MSDNDGAAAETAGGPTEFDVEAWRQVAQQAGASPDDVLQKLEHARTWEKRAKANADAAEKLAKIEDDQKTEVERLTDRLAAETAARQASEARALRYRVAASKGVPDALVDRLRGDTEDELSADADALLGLVKPPPAGPPQASPRQGAPPPLAGDDDPLLRDLKAKLGIS